MKTKNLKNFNHLEVEKKIYKDWQEKKLFSSRINKKKKNFSIIMPPPNVTGNLHIGHALNMTIQDIICRFWRMNGKNVLWQPGTDHAGIATQNVVEKNLLKNKKLDKNKVGKKNFVSMIWKWKEKSGDKIVNQIKRLGASPDWDRLKFTLDKDVSEAINLVFIRLFNKGLIYKDRRLVNWDIKLQTAISDLEVEQSEQKGEFVYIKYYLENSKKFITVATTRPETLFGDCCLAVNPKDKKLKNFIGKRVIIPLTKNIIPIIGDNYVDMEKGSGALKITPAHDFNDFKIGMKLKINFNQIFDKNGKFNNNVPDDYIGLDRLKARNLIIEDLRKNGHLEKIEKMIHTVPIGDRSRSIIEPYLTDQWFLDVKYLAAEAVKKVKKKETEFIPKSWEKIYFSWMKQIEPWCISRQIWWGHQLPVWYGPDKKHFVCKNKKDALALAKKHYKKSVVLKQETDVLDTWFSSALWPLTTLGWPKKTAELKNYFPTDILVTGFDIIFFWVSRMIMQSIQFTKKVPFKKVYIHPLIRDQFGNKMSKSKGNIIDPLELIDEYGADPLRFTLASLASQGKDIKLSEESVRLNRNFITKIWNSYKFLKINKCSISKNFNTSTVQMDFNIWIIKELNDLILKVNSSITKYRFNDAVKLIFSFTKNVFCDWYIEFIKVSLNVSKDEKKIIEIRNCSAYCFNELLKICHPFIPFVTDEIYYNRLKNKNYLDKCEWPKKNSFKQKKMALKKTTYCIGLISKIRNIRSSLDIKPKSILNLIFSEEFNSKFISMEMMKTINSLARVKISHKSLTAKNKVKSAKFIFNNDTYFLKYNIEDLKNDNLKKDLSFLNKELNIFEYEIKRIEDKLKNKNFLERAPKEVIEENKNKLSKFYKSKDKLIHEIKLLSVEEKL